VGIDVALYYGVALVSEDAADGGFELFVFQSKCFPCCSEEDDVGRSILSKDYKDFKDGQSVYDLLFLIFESTPKTNIVVKDGAAAPIPLRGGERLLIVFVLFFGGEGFSEWTHLLIFRILFITLWVTGQRGRVRGP
jgi:hypothetical protein